MKQSFKITDALLLGTFNLHVHAASSMSVVGKDVTFEHTIAGLPSKLSDFPDLQINSFQTSDGVKLTYWEAGSGEPLVFAPGWSGNGAQYLNLLYLLRKKYHVYVLDPRNQGLSAHVSYGARIARMGTDLKEFSDNLGLKQAYYCGHSMGSSVIWSMIDNYGTAGIRKAVFVDEPISIASRPGWTETEKKQYGSIVETPGQLVQMLSPTSADFNKVDLPKLSFLGKTTPAYENSEGFANAVIKNDPAFMMKVLYDHAANDWSDVIELKISVPTAIFSGDLSPNLPSQRWEHEHVPGSQLHVYTAEEGGDHLLMFRNPVKFTHDLAAFLSGSQQ